MLQSLRNYMSADERAKRAITAERRALKAEKVSLNATRIVIEKREADIEKRLRVLKYMEAPASRRASDKAEPIATGSASLSCTGRLYVVEDDACLPEVMTMRDRFEASCDGVTA